MGESKVWLASALVLATLSGHAQTNDAPQGGYAQSAPPALVGATPAPAPSPAPALTRQPVWVEPTAPAAPAANPALPLTSGAPSAVPATPIAPQAPSSASSNSSPSPASSPSAVTYRAAQSLPQRVPTTVEDHARSHLGWLLAASGLGGLALGGLIVWLTLSRLNKPAAAPKRRASPSEPPKQVETTGSKQEPAATPSAGSAAQANLQASCETVFKAVQLAVIRKDRTTLADLMTPAFLSRCGLDLGRTGPLEILAVRGVVDQAEQHGSRWVASVQFTGLMAEGEEGLPEPFSEVWEFERGPDDRHWKLSAIRST